MIITRTPLRISFLGGGTDYPEWAKLNGGIVVGGAINRYSYLTARKLPPFHEFKTRVVYSKIEQVKENLDLEHRAVRSAISYLGLDSTGLEITHMADLPGRSGMGSSSTFVVGLLNALAALQGKLYEPRYLTESAIYIERVLLEETVGSQDQAFAAHGGLNHISFSKNGDINVYPLPIDHSDIADLENHLMLFFTGINRTASDIASTYVPQLLNKQKEQWAMMRLAEQGIEAIMKKDWYQLGRLIDASWRIKCSLSPQVTNADINQHYISGMNCGAVGGKLLGAGGGGCLLFVVPPEKQAEVRQALAGLVEIKVRFDFNGSRIIFADRKAA